MSEEPGGVLGGFSASCKEFGEVEGCFCTHHKQLSQTGTVVQMATWNAKVAFFFFLLILMQQGWVEMQMLSDIREAALWCVGGTGVVKGGAKTWERFYS